MTLSYEFFSRAVRSAYTEHQVSSMQQYGYNIDTIEANARKKLKLPPELPASAQIRECASYTGPVNNHVNMTASYQPTFTNNVGNAGVLHQTYLFAGPYGHSHQQQQQQQQPPQFYQRDQQTHHSSVSGFDDQLSNQQQPPAGFEQCNLDEVRSIDPQLLGNHADLSTDTTGCEQNLQLTSQADTTQLFDSCLHVYKNHFTVPQNETDWVEVGSNSNSTHPIKNDCPPEADPSVVSEDINSNPFLRPWPEIGWGDDFGPFWSDEFFNIGY